ncbi:hypothetical protein AAMO2058_001585900 [Amorphochlora amoebiformis]
MIKLIGFGAAVLILSAKESLRTRLTSSYARRLTLTSMGFKKNYCIRWRVEGSMNSMLMDPGLWWKRLKM